MEEVEQVAEVQVGGAKKAEETTEPAGEINELAEEITELVEEIIELAEERAEERTEERVEERAEERAEWRLSLSPDTSQSKTMFCFSTVVAQVV